MDLAATYRPYEFAEVISQKSVVDFLTNQVTKPRGTYLLHGPRGTGKTTLARIFAREMNCKKGGCTRQTPCVSCELMQEGTHPDIKEMNAANSTGIDNVRSLIEVSNQYPVVGKYKVFIIDEIHQLSSQAQEALLKPLEEPSEFTVWILCTTDPDKLKKTIVSRCFNSALKLLTSAEITTLLTKVAGIEKIPLSQTIVESITLVADGHAREALKALSTHAAALCKGDEVEISRIAEAIKASSPAVLAINYMSGHVKKDGTKVFSAIANADSRAKFLEDVIDCARCLIYKAVGANELVASHGMATRLQKTTITAAAVPGLAAFMTAHVDALAQLKTYQVSDKDVCDAVAARCWGIQYQ